MEGCERGGPELPRSTQHTHILETTTSEIHVAYFIQLVYTELETVESDTWVIPTSESSIIFQRSPQPSTRNEQEQSFLYGAQAA